MTADVDEARCCPHAWRDVCLSIGKALAVLLAAAIVWWGLYTYARSPGVPADGKESPPFPSYRVDVAQSRRGELGILEIKVVAIYEIDATGQKSRIDRDLASFRERKIKILAVPLTIFSVAGFWKLVLAIMDLVEISKSLRRRNHIPLE